MNNPRVIKKYPNRRLYDTEESRYITLADVKRLVLDNTDFVVIDKKSAGDITSCILLQVVCELEQTGEAPVTRNYLANIIRATTHPQKTLVSSFLEQSIRRFLADDNSHDRSWPTLVTTPADGVENAALAHYKRWNAAQDQIYRALAAAGTTANNTTAQHSAQTVATGTTKTATTAAPIPVAAMKL